ncbi:uncharacterized protein M421DRAFT_416277 [Didymella exigua CBS 183.55]|uniref:Uncharacterized protein n=1 Tax=Didymella exigua CBS 183.55 TaxID=1150837 RepID=A0A6A5S595_9PLEO|nr:uncharacterized protein M421DRAFT_416277 [Didymella exigua CBS 183.55]KAF1932657.1 hypothetical protein M421DRAFT_416277 [Didymella exigua CBS 183.55]
MAKRDSFDDVLGNKFSLVNAKSSKLLTSWMGDAPTAPSASHVAEDGKDEDADLKQSDYGHDRLGVGHAVPKDIADGSFTRRAPTSNDKLLEQLIGKKRAKAHLAAKQEAERASARQQPAWQNQQKPIVQGAEESEDEEESRAATIASRGKRNDKAKPQPKSKSVESKKKNEGTGPVEADDESNDAARSKEQPKDDSDDDIDLKPKKRVKKSRAKPTSYLDELLAERSKKKKGKGKDAKDI